MKVGVTINAQSMRAWSSLPVTSVNIEAFVYFRKRPRRSSTELPLVDRI